MNRNGIPVEVSEYLRNGAKRAVSVRVLCPYVIIVEFEDGQIREKDMNNSLHGVLECLRDWAIFQKVRIDEYGNIAWDAPTGVIDICKDSIYIYGKSV